MFNEKREGKKVIYEARSINTALLPKSVPDLYEAAMYLKPIGKGIILVPGMKTHFLPEEPGEARPSYSGVPLINGQYGILLKSQRPESDENLAVAGFSIGWGQMEIEHSPQGANPRRYNSHPFMGKLSHSGRNELLVSNYRMFMMQVLIDLARSMDLEKIKGIAAENHMKVTETKELSLETGQRIMDKVYRDALVLILGVQATFYPHIRIVLLTHWLFSASMDSLNWEI